MLVVGMGEQKTPSSFINACDKFLYMDILLKKQKKETSLMGKTSADQPEKAKSAATGGESRTPEQDGTLLKPGMNKEAIIKTISELIEENSDDDGWYFMGALGNRLLGQYPDFDTRNFGFSKLTAFVESIGLYDFRSDPLPGNPQTKLVYVRKKQG